MEIETQGMEVVEEQEEEEEERNRGEKAKAAAPSSHHDQDQVTSLLSSDSRVVGVPELALTFPSSFCYFVFLLSLLYYYFPDAQTAV